MINDAHAINHDEVSLVHTTNQKSMNANLKELSKIDPNTSLVMTTEPKHSDADRFVLNGSTTYHESIMGHSRAASMLQPVSEAYRLNLVRQPSYVQTEDIAQSSQRHLIDSAAGRSMIDKIIAKDHEKLIMQSNGRAAAAALRASKLNSGYSDDEEETPPPAKSLPHM